MSQVLVVRPGSTALDEQERIKGCLDIPLSESGKQQVLRAIDEFADVELKMIYCAPCESAQATAQMIAEKRQCKWKVCDFFSQHRPWALAGALHRRDSSPAAEALQADPRQSQFFFTSGWGEFS